MEPECSLPCSHVHKSVLPVPILSEMYPIYTLPSYFFKIHFNIMPFVTFRNALFFYGGELLAPTQPPSWRTTPCRLSTTAYSMYS
jgi:hypothetical protein